MLGLLVNRQTNSINTSSRRLLEGMLPDADDLPFPAQELAGDEAVAGYVGLAFAVPEGAVGFGTRVTLGAAVPTASAARWWNVKCQDGTPIASSAFAQSAPTTGGVKVDAGLSNIRMRPKQLPERAADAGDLQMQPRELNSGNDTS